METDTAVTALDNLGAIGVEECETTKSGGYAELSLSCSLTLHVTVVEDATSVVVAEPGERQASIVVGEDGDWRTTDA